MQEENIRRHTGYLYWQIWNQITPIYIYIHCITKQNLNMMEKLLM
jgi:hypothetical protein